MAKTLMVVDDSATMRKIITRTIRKAGLSVADEILEAGDGGEALEKLKSSPVDIVLCDINMPGMNGLEFVKQARQDPANANTKIIMISTESAEDLIHGVKADGADGYVTKPFTPETIQKELSPFM
ncbi:MAG: response regulator [Sedimentisphaerales bacterium]|nr:response regulator [Sedimentisphaerales bacterium]